MDCEEVVEMEANVTLGGVAESRQAAPKTNVLMGAMALCILAGVASGVYAQVVGHHHAFANMRRTIDHLRPGFVIGVGRFAAARVAAAANGLSEGTGGAPHPSPANPAANRGWEREFTAALRSNT